MGMFPRSRRTALSIDMAPLIDVVFLLLIFFMLTSSFVPPSVPLALPRAESDGGGDSPRVVVSLDARGRIAVGTEVVEGGGFEEVLAVALEREGTSTVHFRGDTAVDYGIFLDLVSRARAVGARQFHLVHEREE